MQNYMKTIISAVKSWTTEKIKNNNEEIHNRITDSVTEIHNRMASSVADWNENDSSADSYIKNRPFYEEEIKNISTSVMEFPNGADNSGGATKIDLEFATLLFNNQQALHVVVNSESLDELPLLIEESSNTITWKYTDTANITNSSFFYVHLYLDSNGAPTGEIKVSDNSYQNWSNVTLSVEIDTSTSVIHHLDMKYIKDMYGEEDNVVLDFIKTINEHSQYFDNNITLQSGKMYTVIVNGCKYETKCKEEIGSGYLILDIYDDSGYALGGIYENSCIGFDIGDHVIVIDGTKIKHLDPKYIKDMYCTGEPIETLLVNNLTSDTEEDGPRCTFIVGDNYKVIWNGEEHDCTCYEYYGYRVLGTPDDGYPFYIDDDGGDALYIGCANEDEPWTVSIIHIQLDIHKIPSQYVGTDWNQNDPEDAGYIANRTHWDNSASAVELVPETTVEFDLTEQDYVEGAIDIDLVIGETYLVTWNGMQYECVCYEADGCPAIGNDECWDGTNTVNGEPFLVSNYDGLTAINVYESGSYTISIIGDRHDLKQLDIKYLPIMKEVYGTLYEIDDITNENHEFFDDPSHQMLLGKHRITVDGNIEILEFVDDGGYSWAGSDNIYIETWYGGVHFWFPDFHSDNPQAHSVKIEKPKQVVKEEYLPESITAKPDWSQSDPNGAGYIENRPFYENEIVDTIKENVIYDCSTNEYYCRYGNADNTGHYFAIEFGTYRVIFDGNEYICTSIETPYGFGLGNMSIPQTGSFSTQSGYFNDSVPKDDTGEPFAILWGDIDAATVEVFANTSGQHTISIYKIVDHIVHHLDPKYIKDMYYEENTINSNTLEFDMSMQYSGGAKQTNLEFANLLFNNKDKVQDIMKFIEGGVELQFHDVEQDTSLRIYFIGDQGMHYHCIVELDSNGLPTGVIDAGDNQYQSWSNIAIQLDIPKETIHYLDPKYIKDMYYEEENVVDITGLSFPDFVFDSSPSEHNLNIPFALGQVWDMHYVTSGTESSYEGLEVKEAEDGTLYIGTYPDMMDVPFYITNNADCGNVSWLRMIQPTDISITCVSGTVTGGEPIIHHINEKYIPDTIARTANLPQIQLITWEDDD